MGKRLSELVDISLSGVINFEDVEIQSVTCDSREVGKCSLFVAIKGNKTDGHLFIREALEKGCSALVLQKAPDLAVSVPVIIVSDIRRAYAEISARFYDNPSSRLNVIGVTGTNGKTTTTFLLKSILEAAGERVGLLGSIVNSNGSKVIPSALTTPDVKFIQDQLYNMLVNNCRTCVMEVSSHALDQSRVESIRFAAAVFTSLSRDHLDYHTTMKNYILTKARLFRRLNESSIATLNADDDSFDLLKRLSKGIQVTYGINNGNIKARVNSMNLHGASIAVDFPNGESINIHSSLIGVHNIYNILAASTCLYTMGYDIDVIKSGIEKVKQIPGRLEEVSICQDFRVFVDYAHTPGALEKVLSCLKQLTKGRLIVVFGCGGDRDKGKRPQMAAIVQSYADVSIVTSDNPRSEDPLEIIRQIETGFSDHAYIIEPDRFLAIQKAICMAKTCDTVLIAGKGHENYQIIYDKIIPFDDRLVAHECLKNRVLSALRHDVASKAPHHRGSQA